jgi:hypothetical protein
VTELYFMLFISLWILWLNCIVCLLYRCGFYDAFICIKIVLSYISCPKSQPIINQTFWYIDQTCTFHLRGLALQLSGKNPSFALQNTFHLRRFYTWDLSVAILLICIKIVLSYISCPKSYFHLPAVGRGNRNNLSIN